MSVALINSHMAAAATAMVVDDFATARKNASAAFAYLAALPDTEKGDERLEWDRKAVLDFIGVAKQGEGSAAAAAAGGMEVSKVQWKPTSASV